MGQNGASVTVRTRRDGQNHPTLNHSTTQGPLTRSIHQSLDHRSLGMSQTLALVLLHVYYTTHLCCVSTARCDLGVVLLSPIPRAQVHGTRAPFAFHRYRTPLLRRASPPRPLGLHVCPCIRTYIHASYTQSCTHICSNIPGQGVLSRNRRHDHHRRDHERKSRLDFQHAT